MFGYIIKSLSLINHSLYMWFYIPYSEILGIDINGSPTFISPMTRFDVAYCSYIHLSDKVVITHGVNILAHDFSISRGAEALGILKKEFPIIKDVYIGENTFIGVNSIILPGSRIGKNVIIGAGTVVRGIIPDNSLVVGNPAKIVCQTI
jgi:acetyltransferase-like isoleucine patch superfamily enzyme